MSADTVLQQHALAVCKELKQRCVASCQQCLPNKASVTGNGRKGLRTDAISQHTQTLQLSLGTMMYLSEAELSAAASTTAEGGCHDFPMADTTLSTVLQLTALSEKNVPVSKALHDVHCTQWCWRLVLHASRHMSMSALRAETTPPSVAVSGGAPLGVHGTGDAHRHNANDLAACHRVAWSIRTIGNLLACKERRINELVLRLGVVAYCCRVVVVAARVASASASALVNAGFVRLAPGPTPPSAVRNHRLQAAVEAPSQVPVAGAEGGGVPATDVWARRELLKQAARTIGNACFGSSPRDAVCGAQACKAFVLSTEAGEGIMEKDAPSSGGTEEHPRVIAAPATAAACTLHAPGNVGALGSLVRLLHHKSVVFDTPVCRWLLHALNECMYGQTPNPQQRTAVVVYDAHNAVATVLRDVVAAATDADGCADDADDADALADGSTASNSSHHHHHHLQPSRMVLMSVGLAALNNLMFRFPCPGPEHHLLPWFPDLVRLLEATVESTDTSGAAKWLHAVRATVVDGGWLPPSSGSDSNGAAV